mgnify:CR=1 FL=1
MKLNDFINKELKNDSELKKEYDLLDLKYKVIEELINYRKNNNLTQAEFAKKTGLSQQEISRFEKGEIDSRLSFISKILNEINVNIIFEKKDYIKTTESIDYTKKYTKIIPFKEIQQTNIFKY